jgi:hypothetical protein
MEHRTFLACVLACVEGQLRGSRGASEAMGISSTGCCLCSDNYQSDYHRPRPAPIASPSAVGQSNTVSYLSKDQSSSSFKFEKGVASFLAAV